MKKNRVRKFSIEELSLLKSCQYSDKELSVVLDRSEESIHAKRYSLRHAEKARATRNKCKLNYYEKFSGSSRKRCYWSEDDLNLLFDTKYTDSQLSELMGRSVNSIAVKRHRIKKDKLLPKRSNRP